MLRSTSLDATLVVPEYRHAKQEEQTLLTSFKAHYKDTTNMHCTKDIDNLKKNKKKCPGSYARVRGRVAPGGPLSIPVPPL